MQQGFRSILKNQKVYFEKQLKAAQADAAQMRAAIMKGDYLERKTAVDDFQKNHLDNLG